jgi:hypothetical protein
MDAPEGNGLRTMVTTERCGDWFKILNRFYDSAKDSFAKGVVRQLRLTLHMMATQHHGAFIARVGSAAPQLPDRDEGRG